MSIKKIYYFNSVETARIKHGESYPTEEEIAAFMSKNKLNCVTITEQYEKIEESIIKKIKQKVFDYCTNPNIKHQHKSHNKTTLFLSRSVYDSLKLELGSTPSAILSRLINERTYFGLPIHIVNIPGTLIFVWEVE